MAEEKFILHVYYAEGEHKEFKFTSMAKAINEAYIKFEQANCYKCKVWNLDYGPIEPNNPNAVALVFSLQ